MKNGFGLVLFAVFASAALLFACQANDAQKQSPAVAPFSASMPAALSGKTVAPGGKVFVDGLNKQALDKTVAVKNEDGFDINGWAFDPATQTAPQSVVIELAALKGDTKYYAAANRAEREDLAKAFNNPSLKKAAYTLKADLRSVPPGEYAINILQVTDGSAITAASGVRINKVN